MRVADLTFSGHTLMPGRFRAQVSFPNGYALSIITEDDRNLFEVALLHKDHFAKDTDSDPIVLRWLDGFVVDLLLDYAETLPASEDGTRVALPSFGA